jgi:hypothetical protein
MKPAGRPLRVEIVAYAPTAFYHCTHCEVVWSEVGFGRGLHAEQVRSALPPSLQADYQAVSDWVHGLRRDYGRRIEVRVIDAASMDGFWKSLRHRLSRYPAVLVDGERVSAGTEFEPAAAAIERRLAGTERQAGKEVP